MAAQEQHHDYIYPTQGHRLIRRIRCRILYISIPLRARLCSHKPSAGKKVDTSLTLSQATTLLALKKA